MHSNKVLFNESQDKGYPLWVIGTVEVESAYIKVSVRGGIDCFIIRYPYVNDQSSMLEFGILCSIPFDCLYEFTLTTQQAYFLFANYSKSMLKYEQCAVDYSQYKALSRLVSLEYNQKGFNAQPGSTSAGVFPFTFEQKSVTLYDGTVQTKEEFFNIMRRIGSGLSGEPILMGKRCDYQSVNVVTGKYINNSEYEAMLEGCTVIGDWKNEYAVFSIPLNLFTTVIKANYGYVRVSYIANQLINLESS